MGNSPRLFYPLFPLLQKRCLLRFGYGVWVLELSWTLFWISCKDSHVNEINFSRLVFVKKVINGNIAVVNDPVLHTLCLDTTDSCRHHKIRLRRQRILGDPQVPKAHVAFDEGERSLFESLRFHALCPLVTDPLFSLKKPAERARRLSKRKICNFCVRVQATVWYPSINNFISIQF